DQIYDLPADQPIKERIAEIFGKDYRASLITFAEETSYLSVKGVLADPKLTKRSRGEQFLYINGRPFKHRYLVHMVLKIYETWIGENDYPFFALFIEVDPAEVDVNVHPAKEEVKFEDERSLIKLTRSVIKKTLNERFMVPEVPGNDTLAGSTDFKAAFSSDLSFQPKNKPSEGVSRFPSRINFETNSPRGQGDAWAESLYSSENPQG